MIISNTPKYYDLVDGVPTENTQGSNAGVLIKYGITVEGNDIETGEQEIHLVERTEIDWSGQVARNYIARFFKSSDATVFVRMLTSNANQPTIENPNGELVPLYVNAQIQVNRSTFCNSLGQEVSLTEALDDPKDFESIKNGYFTTYDFYFTYVGKPAIADRIQAIILSRVNKLI